MERIEILTIERILGNYHTNYMGNSDLNATSPWIRPNSFCSFSTNYFVVVRRDLKLANRFVEPKRPMRSGLYTGFPTVQLAGLNNGWWVVGAGGDYQI